VLGLRLCASLAVIGLGGVGLAALLAGRMLEATSIVAIDLNETKLATARELGATLTMNAADPDCVDRVREATGGGVAYAFEMAGSARALELARVTAHVSPAGTPDVVNCVPAVKPPFVNVASPFGSVSVTVLVVAMLPSLAAASAKVVTKSWCSAGWFSLTASR
jgi:Zn-dependent alcohol dehydrogenase